MPVKDRPKRTAKAFIPLTPDELEEVRECCRKRGGIPVAQYFRTLHLEKMGRIEDIGGK